MIKILINLSLPISLIFSNEIPEKEKYKLGINQLIIIILNIILIKKGKEKKINLFFINKERKDESELLKSKKK